MEQINETNWAGMLRDEMMEKNKLPSFGGGGGLDYLFASTENYTIIQSGTGGTNNVKWLDGIKSTNDMYVDTAGQIIVTHPGLYLIRFGPFFISSPDAYSIRCIINGELFGVVESSEIYPHQTVAPMSGVLPVGIYDESITTSFYASKNIEVEQIDACIIRLQTFDFKPEEPQI